MNRVKIFGSQNRKLHLPVVFFLLLLVLSLKISMVESQTTNNLNPNPNPNPNRDNQYPNAQFSPMVAIIIVVLVAALFFMGFFSIYIRQCSDTDNSGNSVQNALAIARRAAAGRTAAARGLEASVIETFPTFSYAEVKDHKIGKGVLECAVCLNEFENDETLRLIPKCDHVFHPECIDAWLENHVTCPVCRASLIPEAGEEPYQPPELNQDNIVNNDSQRRNDDVAIQLDVQEEQVEVKPDANRIWSFKYSNRPPRAESIKREGRNMFGLGKFRSHSTGHVIQPGENVDRFTLRLPEEIRKEMMNRALLNRTKSVAVHLPRGGSTRSRRWFRTGLGEGSIRGINSLPRVEEPDPAARSDRWLFSKAAPFISRMLSSKSTKVVAENSDATIVEASTIVASPSSETFQHKNIDEKSLLHTKPFQLSV